MKSVLLLFFALLLHQTILMCQDADSANTSQFEEQITHPNIIKINTFALAFNNVSLLYERAINPRISVGMGMGYKYSGVIPKVFSINSSTISIESEDIQGFSITPEARYYLKSCDPGKVDGFYAGLYLRYTGFQSAGDFDYEPENGIPEFYESDIDLDEFGVGLQLGYQLRIKERFSIDFLILGPRISWYSFDYGFTPAPSQQFLDDFSDYLNEVIDRFGFDYDVEVEPEGEGNFSTNFSFVNTRFGLSLGYSF